MAQMLAGGALALAVALLAQRRFGGLLRLAALQGGVVAAALAWQAWARGAPVLLVLALAALAGLGVAAPWRLRGAAAVAAPVGATLPPLAALALGLALAGLACAVVPAREDLAAAVAAVLVALLATALLRAPPAQCVTLLALVNALILAAIGATA